MTDLLESTENGITTLTLNRPERLNALSPTMTAGLSEALERLSTDSAVGAIVIAGTAYVGLDDLIAMKHAAGRDLDHVDIRALEEARGSAG